MELEFDGPGYIQIEGTCREPVWRYVCFNVT